MQFKKKEHKGVEKDRVEERWAKESQGNGITPKPKAETRWHEASSAAGDNKKISRGTEGRWESENGNGNGFGRKANPLKKKPKK